MSITLRTPFLLLATMAVVVAPLAAQRRAPARRAHPVARARVHHAFRVGDRGIFRNYYRTHHLVLKPLRPEVARLVVRGKPLPEGVVRVALAPDLLALVPPPETGYTYAIVGDRIVMLDPDGLVDDILEEIFP
ncbi:MAG: hypothetical protein V4503_05235 [Gemmatimonadota bacterium]